MNEILEGGARLRAHRGLAARRPSEIFAEMGETLKVERLQDIPEGETITLYRHGEFLDLCRGPHVQRLSQIGAVKLLNTSGAYFRGDESNEMLQRIYGTAFGSQEGARRVPGAAQEQARARDHRRLGRSSTSSASTPTPPAMPVLPPEGRGRSTTASSSYVRELYAERRLRRGGHAADPRRRPLAHLGPLRELPRRDVLHRGGRAPARGQADELPDPLPDLQNAAALLPRPADPLRRLRPPAPLRAQRRDRRPDPGALVQPGRRPHLLHRGPGRARRSMRSRRDRSSSIYETFGFQDVQIELSTRPEKSIGTAEQWENAESALQRGARGDIGDRVRT